MKYLIEEKIFSIADKFTIMDENRNPIFNVEGKVFTLGNKLRIFDLNGRELSYIEQELFKLLAEYQIFQEGKKVGRVKKELTFFKSKYNIESIYGKFTIEGDVLSHEFIIKKDGIIVADISKKWFAWSDTYAIDIKDNVDHVFILSLVIVLDQVHSDGDVSSSSSSSSNNS